MEIVNKKKVARPLLQNHLWLEFPFYSYGSLSRRLLIMAVLLILTALIYMWDYAYIAFLVAPFMLAILMNTCRRFGELASSRPTSVWSRERQEVYLFSPESDYLMVRRFDPADLIICGLSLGVEAGAPYPLPEHQPKEGKVASLLEKASLANPASKGGKSGSGSVNSRSFIPVVENSHKDLEATRAYIRRYMDPTVPYDGFPGSLEGLWDIAGTGLLHTMECSYCLSPGRLPRQLTSLLGEKGKEVPLPEGWAYGVWVPYQREDEENTAK